MTTLTLTERAVQQVKSLLTKQKEPKDGLRIAVIGGGCSGKQYKLAFDNAKEADEVLEFDGLHVLVDPKSAQLLAGVTVEFRDDLEKSGFEVINPNATGGCGCGKSFC